jgi:hypothetical protein
MLQLPEDSTFPELTLVDDEPSRTPAIETHGLRLHSGDISLYCVRICSLTRLVVLC